MNRMEQVVAELTTTAREPGKAVKELKDSGKKLVGMFPVYTPDEIVVAAGAVPVGMWGASTKISKARTYLPPFACSIMQSVLELEIKGTYDVLDAVIIPSLCDTLICMGQKWKGKCPVICMAHPQNRALEAACVYLTKEYRLVAAKLEKVLGTTITDDALKAAIKVCNANRSALNTFAKVAEQYPQIITPAIRHNVFKARYFMEREKHTELVNELVAELQKQPVKPWNGKKVILTGITFEPEEILDILGELDVAVAADDLAQESRQTRTLVPEVSDDPLYNLAKMWQNVEGCALAGDMKKKHGPILMKMLKEHNADAIVVCMMKFCDPEEFDYAVYNTQFDNAGVKHTLIEIDQEATAFEQIRTRLQSLVEIL